MNNEPKIALLLAERNSRATDLRHYRGMSLAVLAGAGTIFFGLMLIYARLLDIDIQQLSHVKQKEDIGGMIRWLTFVIPILGIIAQVSISWYVITIALRVRNTVYRLEEIHCQLGVSPYIAYPWHDRIGVRREKMHDNAYFYWRQVITLYPAYVIILIWIYLFVSMLLVQW